MWYCLLGALGGLLYSLVALGLAIVLSGAGDGWCAPLLSVTGLVLIPLVGAILPMDNPPRRRKIAGFLTGAMLGIDVLIFFASVGSGWQGLTRTWSAAPTFVIIWVLMWTSWQFVVLRIQTRAGGTVERR